MPAVRGMKSGKPKLARTRKLATLLTNGPLHGRTAMLSMDRSTLTLRLAGQIGRYQEGKWQSEK